MGSFALMTLHFNIPYVFFFFDLHIWKMTLLVVIAIGEPFWMMRLLHVLFIFAILKDL